MLKKIIVLFLLLGVLMLFSEQVDAVDIDDCQRISSAGTFDLIQDISTTRDCLLIRSDGITINMNGFTISGDGGVSDFGIENSVGNNNLIVNGAGLITNFGQGIRNDGANGIFNNIKINVTDDGIRFDAGNNNTIFNMDINNSDVTGISLLSNSNNNHIYNNTILNSNILHGISLSASSNNLIENNTIRFMGNRGIRFSSNSDNNTARNNIISNITVASFAIQSGSDNNIVIDNTLENCFGTLGCFDVENSDNNVIKENRLNTSDFFFVRFIGTASNNLFSDMDFGFQNDAQVFYTFSATGINNTFLNVTYNTSNEEVNDDSELIRKWHYISFVEDDIGNEVADVNVTAFNVTNAFQFNLTTGVDGFTEIEEITDYVNDGGNRSFFSNYTIFASNGTCSDSHEYNVTEKLSNYKDVFVCGVVAPPPPQPEGCTYNGTGDFDLTGHDNCTISTVEDIGGNNVIINSSGFTTFTNSILNVSNMTIFGSGVVTLTGNFCATKITIVGLGESEPLRVTFRIAGGKITLPC